MDFNKTDNIKTHDQLKNLVKQYKSFIEMGEGQPAQFLDEFCHLVSGDFETGIKFKNYTWINKSLKEIEKEENKVKAESDLLAHYQTPEGLEDWRNVKVKVLSAEMFFKWIDESVSKFDYYDLSSDQLLERKSKQQEILDFHNIQEYKTDEELKALMPQAPPWAKLELSK